MHLYTYNSFTLPAPVLLFTLNQCTIQFNSTISVHTCMVAQYSKCLDDLTRYSHIFLALLDYTCQQSS